MPFIAGVVLGLLHTSAAATRDARASCVSGSVEGTPLTIATHDPASTRCRDSSEENQPSVSPSICVQSSNKEDALDFFRVNNESTDYHASSFTLTEGATFYLDVEGHLEVVADESWCVEMWLYLFSSSQCPDAPCNCVKREKCENETGNCDPLSTEHFRPGNAHLKFTTSVAFQKSTFITFLLPLFHFKRECT